MTDKKTIIIAQALISMTMAAAMSGIMSMIAMGPTLTWLKAWPGLFITAWPIAFVLTTFVSKAAFGLAVRIRAQL